MSCLPRSRTQHNEVYSLSNAIIIVALLITLPHSTDGTQCEAGTYSGTNGSTVCQDCPENTDSPEASTSSDACMCKLGTEPKLVTIKCSGDCPCPEGPHFNSGEIRSQIGSLYDNGLECNWFISSPSPITVFFSSFHIDESWDRVNFCVPNCPKWNGGVQISSDNVNSVYNMTSHFHMRFKTAFKRKFTGFVLHWSTAAGISTGCSMCNAGTYKMGRNDERCSVCTANQYSTKVGAISDVCQPCPVNSLSLPGSSNVSACLCSAGWTRPFIGGQCVQCGAGKFKASVGDDQCKMCSVGKFVAGVGSAAETDCTCVAGLYKLNVSQPVMDRGLVIVPGRAQFRGITDHNTDLLDLKTGVDGWRLVRFLPPTSTTWFKKTDQLNGTYSLGTANDFTTKWSIPFGEFDEFCFGTLGLQKWLHCTKDAAIGTYISNDRPVKKSSRSDVAYEEYWLKDDGRLVILLYFTVIYREPGDDYGAALFGTDGGMGVWVRSSTINSPTVVTISGSFRHDVVAFDRSLRQYLDSGARTFRLATNGGCTVIAMVMFTGTPHSGERVLDLANGLNIDSIILSRSNNSSALKFAIFNGGAECFVTTSSATIVQNTWLTIVATYVASNFRIDLTVNGVSFTNTCESARTDRSFLYTYVGGGGTGSDFFFQGHIAWLYTVDSALQEKGIEHIITNLNANEDISVPCMQCLRGTYGVLGACNSCDEGTYSDAMGSTACTECPPGKTSQSGASALAGCLCLGGSVLDASTQGCTPCFPGTFSTTGQGYCSQCPAGTYSQDAASSCTNCTAGTFSGSTPATSPQHCVECPAGTFSSQPGAVSLSQCLLCSKGKFSQKTHATSATTCANCAPSTYSDAPGSTACTPCPANTFSWDSGLISEDMCLVFCFKNQYRATIHSRECTYCPQGSYMTQGSKHGAIGIQNCQMCALGTYYAPPQPTPH